MAHTVAEPAEPPRSKILSRDEFPDGCKGKKKANEPSMITDTIKPSTRPEINDEDQKLVCHPNVDSYGWRVILASKYIDIQQSGPAISYMILLLVSVLRPAGMLHTCKSGADCKS